MAKLQGIVPRFMSYVDISPDNKCWKWTGYKKGGYGAFKIFGSQKPAHRISYELFNGPIRDGLLVCHKCDNPKCVNPEHLFLGTHKDNMDDKVIKGRHKGANFGSNHHMSRLTEWQVKEILENKDNLNQYELSEKYKVSQTTISNIFTKKRWKHI